jgi:uncharacterized protein YkwD
MRREWVLAVSFVCLIASPPCRSQTVQHHDVEVIDAQPYRSPDEKVPDLKSVIRGLVDQTNAFREREKQPRLTVNPKLAATAQEFADYMAATNRYGHTADGDNPGGRANKHEYDFSLISENIAYAFNSTGFTVETLDKQFMEAWEHSPGHRKNMLDPDVSETGMAVARSEKTGYYYAVQMFARPKSKNIQVEIANKTETTILYRLADQKFELPPLYTRRHEQGRPTELTVELPAKEKPQTKTFKVDGKMRFRVVDEGGTLRIKQE